MYPTLFISFSITSRKSELVEVLPERPPLGVFAFLLLPVDLDFGMLQSCTPETERPAIFFGAKSNLCSITSTAKVYLERLTFIHLAQITCQTIIGQKVMGVWTTNTSMQTQIRVLLDRKLAFSRVRFSTKIHDFKVLILPWYFIDSAEIWNTVRERPEVQNRVSVFF